MQTAQALQIPAARLEMLPALTPLLLDWYDASKRDLPWRHNVTPYRVWVSEIMLQQTRVEAVKEHYQRFLAALPDIPALCAAPEDGLLKLWEGLGYYSRVRNLQKAARVVCRDYGGRLPASYEALLKLPGFGEYTAGAVASIAFGIPQPCADGNVYRVLSRILCTRADISLSPVKAAFRQCAASMVPGLRPGDFNQSMMELGATVCLPNAEPLCGQCPVGEHCAALNRGCAGELPVKAAKKPRRIEQRTVLVVVAGGKVLLQRREYGGLLAGMFAPPHPEGHLDSGQVKARVEKLGGICHQALPLRHAKHLFSHVEWRMRGFLVRAHTPFPLEEGVWANAEELTRNYALPSAFSAYTKDLPLWLARENTDG